MDSPELDRPQAKKLYDWEDLFGYSRVRMWPNLAQPRKWVRWACALFKIKHPKVLAQRKGQMYSWYCSPRDAIYLYNNHYNVWAVLHEVAHVITEKKWNVTGHGPRFAGVLIYLLIKSGLYPQTALYASAKAAGVKFLKQGWVAPRSDHQNKKSSKSNKLAKRK
jgi:hypothetical protein